MKNRSLSVRVLITMMSVVLISGCSEMPQLVRKKKEEDSIKKYVAVREYDVRPSLELYTKRYVFWKNWHKELLSVLDDSNKKKAKVAVEQEVSNLWDMQRMLADPKAEELGVIIEKLTVIEKEIKKDQAQGAKQVRMRRQLELLGKQVKRDFSYRKIEGQLRARFSERRETEEDTPVSDGTKESAENDQN